MKGIFSKLQETKRIASETEKAVIEYIIKNPVEAIDLNVRQLANRTFSSPSTIIRMCQRMGFEGYKDFKRVLTYEAALVNHVKFKDNENDISKFDTISEIAEKITSRNISSLEENFKLIDMDVLQKCVELIEKADNICLFGMGASLLVARDAYLKFLRINKRCSIDDDWHSQLLQAKNMDKNDVGIVFSYSGHTVEVIECMREMKNNGSPIIAVTRNTPSLVDELSDYSLYIPSDEPIMRIGAMTSRICQMNVVDILFMAYTAKKYEEARKVVEKNFIEKPEI